MGLTTSARARRFASDNPQHLRSSKGKCERDTWRPNSISNYGKTYAIVANFGVSASDGGIADFSHTASFAYMSAAEGTTLVSSAASTTASPAQYRNPNLCHAARRSRHA